MMYLIIGRTATGKDTLAHRLEDHGFKAVKSYTTRPQRSIFEDTHIFISPAESANYKDKVATTKINGYEYFATAEQVQASDIYIIDPKGFDELTKNMPKESFFVVYMAARTEMSKKAYLARGGADADEATKKKIEDEFNARTASETAMFDEFEKRILKKAMPDNVLAVLPIANNFSDSVMDYAVQSVIDSRSTIQHLVKFTYSAINHQVINGTPNFVYAKMPNGKYNFMPIEKFAWALNFTEGAFDSISKKLYSTVSPKIAAALDHTNIVAEGFGNTKPFVRCVCPVLCVNNYVIIFTSKEDMRKAIITEIIPESPFGTPSPKQKYDDSFIVNVENEIRYRVYTLNKE